MIARDDYPRMQTSALGPIDTSRCEFLACASPLGERRVGMEDLALSVEPESGDRLAEEATHLRARFPLRPAKIQRPFLPKETLRRDRLFGRLEANEGQRLLYIVAEAGFGKTTLIADFLRHSQVRTFWYRLDEDDTDGLVFLRYVVAACQAVDPRLLARTAALLEESTLEPTPVEAVAHTILGELDALGNVPSALVLDDFHMAESVPAIGALVERLLDRTPAGLKIIVASRRTPGLSVAAMRARGQLAEMGRDELRFDEAETGKLFRDSYRHPLEPDVLHDLQARTDGWAASLALVKTAVDGRTPGQVRAFVGSLSGSEGPLYDYLAEEVVGDLDPELRGFLVRTSILEDVEPDTAAVAASVTRPRARILLRDAQAMGLMSRGGDVGSTWRPHPLVREFLLAHLESEVGEAGVAELHRRLARVMEPRSWRMAARHWAAGGDSDEVRRVVCAATPTIIGTGDLAAAKEFIVQLPADGPNPWFDIIESRLLSSAGRKDQALAVAKSSAEAAGLLALEDRSFAMARALNTLRLGIDMADIEALTRASVELSGCDDAELVAIAKSATLLFLSSESGTLGSLSEALIETARINREKGHRRHEGISLLNLAFTELARGDHGAAEAAATRALSLLASTGDATDVAAARIGVAKALAHKGAWAEALSHIQTVLAEKDHWVEPEAVAEAVELLVMYGDPALAQRIAERELGTRVPSKVHPHWALTSARLELARGHADHAAELIASAGPTVFSIAHGAAVRSLDLQIRASRHPADPNLSEDLLKGLQLNEVQEAWFWWKSTLLTRALVSEDHDLLRYFASLEPSDAAHLSVQAELVVRRLGDLDQNAFQVVFGEAIQRPDRWRLPLRGIVSKTGARIGDVKMAVMILEVIGEAEDVVLLKSIGKKKSLRIHDAGRQLMHRLAPHVYVEDLGRVSVRIGQTVLVGTEIRRKVLSLLCFLLTRPQFTATREQVLEALWPEMDPDGGANSLNQSAYFLRRTFEPGCDDDNSAGYLRSRSDLIWLDNELVASRSTDCLDLLARIRRDPSPDLIVELANLYTGRFAVDFLYDDWASSFRDTLHAGFLDRIERAIITDTKIGAFDRALTVAQLALQADPEAEQIELCLLRLYRRTGATAAAAEQYSHYAGLMRDQLGIEPPPLDSI